MNIKIIGGLLCKNEAERWLNKFLASFSQLCDEIVVIDDKSNDKSPEICAKYGTVYLSPESYFETREWMQRETLFHLCLARANLNDWVIILDADELLNDSHNLRKFLINCPVCYNGYSIKLYDMWNETHYRSDFYWNAHERHWQMATRKRDIDYTWRKTNLHCGRLPLEIKEDKICYNESFYIKHMGWSTEKDRLHKYDRYMKIDGNGQFGWLDQYKSILDKHPNLIKLEDKNI